ncbi:hypothetical protein ATANTOWER_001448 [Ataeniobius toweri]|uniref:Uncharacterized protein n=1 Tax=Ataeniobius toweri TaxID=208326 RepID=A0ABU7CH25_9TELE|nr:hypothetical protein [Ataeniobius toweri]
MATLQKAAEKANVMKGVEGTGLDGISGTSCQTRSAMKELSKSCQNIHLMSRRVMFVTKKTGAWSSAVLGQETEHMLPSGSMSDS